MTGPEPAEKKPTRAARGGATAKSTPPDPITTDAPEAASTASAPEPAATLASEPVAPVVAEPVVAEPVAVATPSPALAAPAAPPDAAAAAPAGSAPEAAAAPEPAGTSAGQPAASASKLSTPDVAGAVDKAIDGLRTYLTVGEIIAGLGAFGILMISYATFGVIFGHGGTAPSEVVMLLSIGLLAVLVLQNAHWHDFGPNYRLIVAGACFALGIIAAMGLIAQLSAALHGGDFDIGGLTWWAGAWVAVLGGVLVWREGR